MKGRCRWRVNRSGSDGDRSLLFLRSAACIDDDADENNNIIQQ
jgi:hypothetical protein